MLLKLKQYYCILNSLTLNNSQINDLLFSNSRITLFSRLSRNNRSYEKESKDTLCLGSNMMPQVKHEQLHLTYIGTWPHGAFSLLVMTYDLITTHVSNKTVKQ